LGSQKTSLYAGKPYKIFLVHSKKTLLGKIQKKGQSAGNYKLFYIQKKYYNIESSETVREAYIIDQNFKN